MTTRTKTKISKHNYINLKSFCIEEKMINKLKRQSTGCIFFICQNISYKIKNILITKKKKKPQWISVRIN